MALSACHDEQLAQERHIRQNKQGVFTFALCHKLKFEPQSPSYRNLLDATRQPGDESGG
ncbi:MAG: hypothetical protein R3E95_17930 [Thiolinea sp.]